MDLRSFFSTTTRRGRAIRTAFQAMFGLLTFVAGFLTIPGLETTLESAGIVVQAGAIAGWIGVVSYLQNATEALIKYVWGDL